MCYKVMRQYSIRKIVIDPVGFICTVLFAPRGLHDQRLHFRLIGKIANNQSR